MKTSQTSRILTEEALDSRAADISSGRDEMNLAEFPLTLLADRAPKEQKTLCYASHHGTLLVTGSDAHGLPTAADADVIIGLIQLTRLRNGFADPKVPFTRYELLRVLGWPDESKYYKRLDESLNRWVGVVLHYQNCWWDNRAKRYLSAKLHIIESVILDEKPGRRSKKTTPTSSFSWNTTFIESCQADNLKRLDLDTYFSFRSAVSKRLYRFLDKRFYLRPDWTFDLKEFAFEHVGLSRGYSRNAGKIKEKLQPAIEELEAIEFLEPMKREDRYEKQGGGWVIRLRQSSSRPALIPIPTTLSQANSVSSVPGDGQVAELITRGVSESVAEAIVEAFGPELVAAKIDVHDWLTSRDDRRVRKSPSGYLVESIRKNYEPPKGYLSGASKPGLTPVVTAATTVGSEASDEALIEAMRLALSPEQREQVEVKALAATSNYYRTRYRKLRDTDPARAALCLRSIVDQYLAGRIAETGESAGTLPEAVDGRFRLAP